MRRRVDGDQGGARRRHSDLASLRGTHFQRGMERARRHQRALARAALIFLALIAELIGRSLSHRLDFGRTSHGVVLRRRLLPVPARGREGRCRFDARTGRLAFRQSPTSRALHAGARRAPAARSFRDRALGAAVARVVPRHIAHLPPAGGRGGNLRRPLAAAGALAAHSRAAGLRCSLRRRRRSSIARSRMARRLRELRARDRARALTSPARPADAAHDPSPTSSLRAASSGSRSKSRLLPRPRKPASLRRPRARSLTSTLGGGCCERRTRHRTRSTVTTSDRRGRGSCSALGPADGARRRRLGYRPAVPDHVAASTRARLLVALRRAASARDRRRALLPLRRRAGTPRGPGGGGRATPELSTSTGSSRPGSSCSGSACSPRRSWDRGLAAARVARVPVAGDRVRARRPPLAGDGLLHELDDSHARARRVGARWRCSPARSSSRSCAAS